MMTFKIPTQRKYPKYIYYGTERYRLIFKKNLDCYGVTDANARTITIKDGLSPRALLATFIHEVIHLMEFETPLKIKHKSVYKLEKALVELLIDNFLIVGK